jgi:guanylate kinase
MNARACDRGHDGLLIVVTGPSGVGKDTVLRELFAMDPTLCYSVSYTTRAPRPGEVNGVSYWFVDEEEFRAMIDRDEFFEWSTVYGQLKGRSYAAIDEALRSGRDTVVKIDVQGAEKMRRRLGERAVYIFILPPTSDELRQRLTDRATETAEELRAREETSAAEMALKDTYDHQVVNDDARRAAAEILEIIRAERSQRAAS